MSTTTTKTAKKWTRAKAPRVRTGCITWKRHIKCDERKPSCQKCEEGKWICDGYELNPTRRRSKPKAPVSLDLSLVGARECVPARMLLTPHLTPYSSDRPTEMELLYHVRTCTVQDLASSLCRMDFWQIYALPLGHASGPVKSAMCALGSAHKYFKSRQSKRSAYMLPANSELNKNSIEQYNLAISQINLLMQTPSRQNTETILTCCIIFMCIENLQGRYSEYIKHFQSATAILTSLLDLPQEIPPSEPALFPQLKKMKPNEFYTTVSDLLFRVGQDLSIYTGSDVVAKLNLVVPFNLDISCSVTPFPTTMDAEQALFDILRAFDAESYIYSAENSLPPVSPPISTTEWLKSYPFAPSDGSVEITKLKPYFEHWNARFDLYRKQLDDTKISKQEAQRVKVLALTQGVWSGFVNNGNLMDNFQREDAEEMLRRAESLVSGYSDTTPIFHFDGGLVPSMMVLFILCEDLDILKRCPDILRSVHRREGIWNTWEMADIIEAVLLAREKAQFSWQDLPWHVPQLAKFATSFDIPNLDIAMEVLSLDG